MVFFPSDVIDIYEEKTDGSSFGYDDYDSPLSGNVFIVSCIGDFQELNSIEQLREFGSHIEGSGVLYLDISMDGRITSSSKVKINDKDMYRVSGKPIVKRDLLPVVKVMLLLEEEK